MASYKRTRVVLITDLTRYNPLWKVGEQGWTIPDHKFTHWGAFDHFTAVKFDNGSAGDIAWKSLEVILDPQEIKKAAEDKEKIAQKFTSEQIAEITRKVNLSDLEELLIQINPPAQRTRLKNILVQYDFTHNYIYPNTMQAVLVPPPTILSTTN